MVTWPRGYQPAAVAALEPLLGGDEVVEVLVGEPQTSLSGTLLGGYLLVGDDDCVWVLHDRSGRPDVHPWPLLDGPVLRITARAPGRRRRVLYAHPSWGPGR